MDDTNKDDNVVDDEAEKDDSDYDEEEDDDADKDAVSYDEDNDDEDKHDDDYDIYDAYMTIMMLTLSLAERCLIWSLSMSSLWWAFSSLTYRFTFIKPSISGRFYT